MTTDRWLFTKDDCTNTEEMSLTFVIHFALIADPLHDDDLDWLDDKLK